MTYKDRIGREIDRWIEAGLVQSDRRAPMLDMIADPRRLDAATALAWVGSVLLGVALVAFVAANWDALTPILRFTIIVATFLGFAGAGAWAAYRQRPLLTNMLMMLAAIAYAAAVGLTAQIFDLPSDTRAACYGAGLAAYGLALAGRSTGAAVVALILIGFGDFTEHGWFTGQDRDLPWMLFASPLGAYLALRWGSAPLAHISAFAIIYCFTWFAARTEAHASTFIVLALVLGALAASARWLRAHERQFAAVFYGWFTLAALMFFAIGGYLPWFGDTNGGITHRLVWLAASGALIALGRHDRHGMTTAVAVLSLIGAIIGTLGDLGLNLMASAGVFLVSALAALVGGLALRARTKAT
ncbi:MAG: DUF2157 domain-containing protein [Proteobacteria bacterium]|nr:DUF2157 domain-containing protein [Pseudomonadota bacterium]